MIDHFNQRYYGTENRTHTLKGKRRRELLSVNGREVCLVSSTLLDRKTLVNQFQEVWFGIAAKKITGELSVVKLKLLEDTSLL